MAEIVPEGRHLAHAVDAALTKSSNKGTEQAEVLFEIDEGENKGRTVGWRGYFSDKTYEKTLEALYAAGLPDSGVPADDVQAIERILEKQVQVQIVVEHEDNQDGSKTYARVRWVNRIGNAHINAEIKLDDSGKRGFVAKLAALTGKPATGKVKQKPGPKPKNAAAPAATPTRTAPAAVPVNEDDIPF